MRRMGPVLAPPTGADRVPELRRRDSVGRIAARVAPRARASPSSDRE
jgi:hypothetical protein